MIVTVPIKDKKVEVELGKEYVVKFIPGDVDQGGRPITKTGMFNDLSLSQYFMFLNVRESNGNISKYTIPVKEIVEIMEPPKKETN